MSTLADKTVFITGATSGFGAATARLMASEGARVIAAGRRTGRLDALKQEADGRVHAVGLDVRDEASVKEAVAELPAEFAAIDILVNNAGLALGLEPAHEAQMDDWETMIDTNIKGLVYCTRAIIPFMVERGGGHVVNLGSVAGTYPYPGGNVYGGTKAFVHQFSLNLRADLLAHNIRVSCIEPGMARTEFSGVRFHGDTAKAQKTYTGVQPLMAEDVARVIHFVTTQPAHVNINVVEMMTVHQAFGPFAIDRTH